MNKYNFNIICCILGGIIIIALTSLMLFLPMYLAIKVSGWFLFLYSIPAGVIAGIEFYDEFGEMIDDISRSKND